MGILSYDSHFSADFDDRVLAHLQVVIGAKLRRGEAFHFSWSNDHTTGKGRTTIWLHPTVPLVYIYSGSKAPTINREWIEQLMTAANSVAGLRLVPEPIEVRHLVSAAAETG